MFHHALVELRQQELRAEADRERLVRLARPSAPARRPNATRPSLLGRLLDLGSQALKARKAHDRTGAA